MNNKILCINSNPYIRTYTYHSFLHSIISGDDKVSNIVAKIRVHKFNQYIWKEQKQKLSYIKEENCFEFHSNKWNTDMNHCFWRECGENDEIEVEIEKQLYTNSWGAINIFIANAIQKDMLNDDEYTYRFGNFCKDGIYLKIRDDFIKIPIGKVSFPFSLIIRKKDNIFSAIYRKNGTDKILHTSEVVEDSCKTDKIGFEIKLNNNCYFEWLFSNYIQIATEGVDTSPTKIDYLFSYNKNWNTYQQNYFVDYSIINRDLVNEFNLTVLEFVKINLNMNRYVEMWLNENCLENIEDAEKIPPHMHQNLIYGYSDELSIFYVLHMKNGKPTQVKLSYEKFNSQYNYSDNYKLIIPMEYNPNYSPYKLTKEYLVYVLSSFLESRDMDIGMSHIITNEKRIWGMNVFKYFSTNSGIIHILNDIRISHLFLEREKCMLDRLDYLFERNFINKQDKEDIEVYVKDAVILADIIRNLVMKDKLRNNHQNSELYAESIKKHLNKLIEKEKKYMCFLIDRLER